MFRAQIWHWILYAEDSKPHSNGSLIGFMRCVTQLIVKEHNLGHFACSVLVKAARTKLLELFLCMLPSLYTGRH